MKVSYQIPHFLGGVSTQPSVYRDVSQAESILNINLSPEKGAEKRGGTSYISGAAVVGTEGCQTLLTQNSDNDEVLIAAFDSDTGATIRAYNAATGQGIPVNTQAVAYLMGARAKDLRFTRIGDTLLVANTKVTVRAITDATELESAEDRATMNRNNPFAYKSAKEAQQNNPNERLLALPTWKSTSAYYKRGDQYKLNGSAYVCLKTHSRFSGFKDPVGPTGDIDYSHPERDDSDYWALIGGYDIEVPGAAKEWDSTKEYRQGDQVLRYQALWTAREDISAAEASGVLNEFDPTLWTLEEGLNILYQPYVTELGSEPPAEVGTVYATTDGVRYLLRDLNPIALPASEPKKLVWVPEYSEDVRLSAIHPDTMPILLEYDSDTNVYNSAKAPWGVLWSQSNLADLDDWHVPSFINQKISDITVYGGRLTLLAGPNIVLSKTDDLYDFWLDDIYGELLPTDPIDLLVSGKDLVSAKWVKELNKTLVILSTQEQFELSYQGVLSPSTVSLRKTSSYQVDDAIPPVVIGNSLIFAGRQFNSIKLYEYFFDDATQSQVAWETTGHIQSYISGSAFKIAGSTSADKTFVLSPDEIAVNSVKWAGTKKELNGWSKFALGHGATILSAEVLRDEMLLVTKLDSGAVVLERMYLNEYPTDTVAGASLPIRMDCRSAQDFTVSYDSDSDTSTITLNRPSVPEGVVIDAATGTVLYPASEDGPTLTFSGDISTAVGAAFSGYYGALYPSEIVLSEQFIRDGSNRAVTSGRFQILKVETEHLNAGVYQAILSQDGYEDAEHSHSPYSVGGSLIDRLATEDSGGFTIPVRRDARRLSIALGDANDMTYTGYSLLSATIDGEYFGRPYKK